MGHRDRPRGPVSYTHLRAHETVLDLVCRLLLEKKKLYFFIYSLLLISFVLFFYIFSILIVFFLFQTASACIRYSRMTNFHTWLAKTAALLQGVFLLLTFFMGKPFLPLFYTAVTITLLELAAEIILVYVLPVWEANIKGLYWVLKRKKPAGTK